MQIFSINVSTSCEISSRSRKLETSVFKEPAKVWAKLLRYSFGNYEF